MSDAVGLLFKLRSGQTPAEATDSTEESRAVASLIHGPAVCAAEAVGAAVESFTLRPSPFVAEAVGAVMRQVKKQGELMRPNDYLAQAGRRAAEGYRALGEWVASLSEAERAELLRLYEDAPLGEVDVNASAVVM